MNMDKTEITKQQAAAYLRGKLLPYRGHAVKMGDGRIVSFAPDGKYYLLSDPTCPHDKEFRNCTD